jgi:hypothetical protein
MTMSVVSRNVMLTVDLLAGRFTLPTQWPDVQVQRRRLSPVHNAWL